MITIEEAFEQINLHRLAMDRETKALQEERARIDEQISTLIEPHAKEIEYLKNIIQIQVIESQASAKTSSGACIYVNGRKGSVKWDDSALLGYAATHEEILQFRKEGEPGQPSVRWGLPDIEKLRQEHELEELRKRVTA